MAETEEKKKPVKKPKPPRPIAWVDWDGCTGCEVCIAFCPVDCIATVPKEKYGIPLPPVQIKFNECIGCQICARVCTKLTWDAIEMLPTSDFEKKYQIEITETKDPPYGLSRRPASSQIG